MPGVSRPMVSQMGARGQLDGWRDGRDLQVASDPVETCLSYTPRTSRPRKGAGST